MRKLLLLMIFITPRFVIAQDVDLYRNVTNPLSICVIDSSLSTPLHYSSGHGYPNAKDTVDSYIILASDSGSGVISHFWITVPAATDTAHLKLYIDDSLVRWANLYDFFDRPYGVLRQPFTTPTFDANLCDVQMPYKKNFKITMEAIANDVWYAVAWRPYPSIDIRSFNPLSMDAQYTASQDSAENIYNSFSHNPWVAYPHESKSRSDVISAHSTTEIFSLTGPAVIQKLQFTPNSYDASILDSVFINIKWDNSPYSSVNVPLEDFFCIPSDGTNVYALPIRVNKDSGITTYFPMPFEVHSKISLINNSGKDITIASICEYHSTPFDRKEMAYFNAFFSETNPTRYHVYHPVLNSLGIGRLVGLSLSIPDNYEAVSLEGDPFIDIDGNPANLIHYTGTEDYFDGGFYFGFKQFSLPFSGHVQFIQKFYKFHYLDAIDFKKSIAFIFQHGNDNDVYKDYRTCAYYYKLWTPFWVSLDTIRTGELLRISGSGYAPNTSITAMLNGSIMIFSGKATMNGEFDTILSVSSSWKPGVYTLSLNGEEKPEPIVILGNPSLSAVADFLPPVVKYRDTLLVMGSGFLPNERISLYLDSILVSDSTIPIITGSDYSFHGVVHIPNIADTIYHLVAEGESKNRAIANDLVKVTRVLPFEFEDMIPQAHWDSGSCTMHNLSAAWYAKWSQQEIASYDPGDTGKTITFNFFSPVSDTFNVKLLLSRGSAFGNYSYFIDGVRLGIFHGSANLNPSYFDPQPADTLNLGTIYFGKDTHTVKFHCIGKDSIAAGFLLEADLMLLSPVTKMALPQGWWSANVDGENSTKQQPDIALYPNPIGSGDLILRLSTPGTGNTLDVILTDILGREIFSQTDLPITPNNVLTKFDVHTLPTGNYVAEFIIHSGANIQRISRMVQIRE